MPVPQNLMRIVQSVQKNLLRLPESGVFDNLRFHVKYDTLFLTGQVPRPSLKSTAEAAVKNIEAVGKIDNRIVVLPFQRLDEDIGACAYFAIYGHPALSRYNPNRGAPLFVSPAARVAGLSLDPPSCYHPIHIIVNNSKLKLTGVVQNIGDETIVGLVANGIPNVFEVENELAIADEITSIKHARRK